MSDRIRTLIAEDYFLFLAMLRQSLAQDPEVLLIGEAHNGEEAVEKCRILRPDLVLVDVSLPGISGLDAARLIRQCEPKVKIVLLLEEDNREYREAAKASGANASLAKVDMVKGLMKVVRSL